ncbi:hypothetical protein O0L34_g3737 [Tuta absoluta]|nr:hypothetical protein O0L34_g3737 [Tuta absoluta]
MVLVCGNLKCSKDIKDKHFLTCTSCKKYYHLSCENAEKRYYSTMTKFLKDNYKCKECLKNATSRTVKRYFSNSKTGQLTKTKVKAITPTTTSKLTDLQSDKTLVAPNTLPKPKVTTQEVSEISSRPISHLIKNLPTNVPDQQIASSSPAPENETSNQKFIVNITTNNSFNSLEDDVDTEDSYTQILNADCSGPSKAHYSFSSSNGSNNTSQQSTPKLNRSCPDIRQLNKIVTEDLKDYIVKLEQRLLSADTEKIILLHLLQKVSGSGKQLDLKMEQD